MAYNKNETDHFLRTYGYLASVNGNVESLCDRIPHSSENVKEKHLSATPPSSAQLPI